MSAFKGETEHHVDKCNGAVKTMNDLGAQVDKSKVEEFELISEQVRKHARGMQDIEAVAKHHLDAMGCMISKANTCLI